MSVSDTVKLPEEGEAELSEGDGDVEEAAPEAGKEAVDTEEYPEFRAIYEEGYEICLNTERVMEMFSKELYELDRNTVQYMIDEMHDTIDAQKDELNKQQDTIDKQNA